MAPGRLGDEAARAQDQDMLAMENQEPMTRHLRAVPTYESPAHTAGPAGSAAQHSSVGLIPPGLITMLVLIALTITLFLILGS
jgi:hypothetical protein